MISLVLQHLENLQLNLAAIDPAHRFDAADKVAAMASELRRAAVDTPASETEFYNDEISLQKQATHRNH